MMIKPKKYYLSTRQPLRKKKTVGGPSSSMNPKPLFNRVSSMWYEISNVWKVHHERQVATQTKSNRQTDSYISGTIQTCNRFQNSLDARVIPPFLPTYISNTSHSHPPSKTKKKLALPLSHGWRLGVRRKHGGWSSSQGGWPWREGDW